MEKLVENVKGALIVPIVLAIILVPFSLLIGWGLLSLLVFWFVLIPVLTFYLPTIISKNQNHLYESLVGLLVFYGLMVFLIYDHYTTDYFQIMVLSLVINLILVTGLSFADKQGTQAW